MHYQEGNGYCKLLSGNKKNCGFSVCNPIIIYLNHQLRTHRIDLFIHPKGAIMLDDTIKCLLLQNLQILVEIKNFNLLEIIFSRNRI